jgi:hypothetical protein
MPVKTRIVARSGICATVESRQRKGSRHSSWPHDNTIAMKAGERSQARDHAEQAAPKTAAKRFIDAWSSIGELLEQASPEEQRVIPQHYIEVVEITFDDPVGKTGKYVLRLFPEVRPLDATPSRNENGTPIPGGDGGSVLTEDH